MKRLNKKSLTQLLAFGIIGAVNTVSDFVIFNVLYGFAHVPLVLANMCAVTIVMGASLRLNRKYVFKGSQEIRAVHVIKFAAVTLFGLYVIQNIILLMVLGLLQGMHGLTGLAANNIVQANVAKVVGVGGSAVWNFVLYKMWVFNENMSVPERDEDYL